MQLTEPLGPLVERMKKAKDAGILVTSPRSRLLGVVARDAAERFLHSNDCCEPQPLLLALNRHQPCAGCG